MKSIPYVEGLIEYTCSRDKECNSFPQKGWEVKLGVVYILSEYTSIIIINSKKDLSFFWFYRLFIDVNLVVSWCFSQIWCFLFNSQLVFCPWLGFLATFVKVIRLSHQHFPFFLYPAPNPCHSGFTLCIDISSWPKRLYKFVFSAAEQNVICHVRYEKMNSLKYTLLLVELEKNPQSASCSRGFLELQSFI